MGFLIFQSTGQLMQSLAARNIGVVLGLGQRQGKAGRRHEQIWYTGPVYPSPVDQALIRHHREGVTEFLREHRKTESIVNVEPGNLPGRGLVDPQMMLHVRRHFEAPSCGDKQRKFLKSKRVPVEAVTAT